jgi:3-phosphoshikimate 1-carboxyvinyltransferase
MPLVGLRAQHQIPIRLTCHEQMQKRPIYPLVQAVQQLGLTVQYENDNSSESKSNALPIQIAGQLTGGCVSLDGSTSQYLSALLFALPCALNDSEIVVTHLTERPYVEMTLNFLHEQQIQYQHQRIHESDLDIYQIKGKQSYRPFNKTIAIDFSSASYFIAASALIPGSVTMNNIDMTTPQGDKTLIALLKKMGADITLNETTKCLSIRGGAELTGLDIDASDIPDLLPTLAVIATKAKGKTTIYNIAHARIKETDRIHSMADGLSRLGARVEVGDDYLTVYESTLKGADVKGYGDHRTVMALSLAGMLSEGITIVDEAESINKTFPDFVAKMQEIGGSMRMMP